MFVYMVYLCRRFIYFSSGMKAIFVGLLMAICVSVANAQVIRVPVGASHFVSKKSYSISAVRYCRATSQVCVYSLNTSVYETPNYGFNGHSISSSNPDHNYQYSFYYSDNLEFYFTSDTITIFNDTVLYDYSLSDVKNDCGAICPSSQTISPTDQYNIVSYYDSVVRVNNYGQDTITFTHNNLVYNEKKDYSFGLFNNLPDSLYCDSISFVVDSNVLIEMNLLPDAMRYTDFVLHPFDRIIPSLYFSTDAGLFAETTFVNSALKIYATSQGKDTVIVMPITFRFTPKEKSIVSSSRKTGVSFLNVVNPIAQGRLRLFVSLGQRVDTKIVCFDVMGNIVHSLHNGFLEAGDHEFSAELPTGMYYVRMQAGDEVLTRKVTVVR